MTSQSRVDKKLASSIATLNRRRAQERADQDKIAIHDQLVAALQYIAGDECVAIEFARNVARAVLAKVMS